MISFTQSWKEEGIEIDIQEDIKIGEDSGGLEDKAEEKIIIAKN